MIASLPMYDRAETASSNDALWSRVARRLAHAPRTLARDTPLKAVWTHADLVLSQTCGLPYALSLHGRVQYVASPDFRLPETPPGWYHSVLIARADDRRSASALARARPVINQSDSQSGYNALYRFAQSKGEALAPVHVSGAHRMSAKAVAKGKADLAAIDANTWRMITQWDSFARELRIVARTPNTPAMPFICGPDQDPKHLCMALKTAISELEERDRVTLGLFGVAELPTRAYLDVPAPPPPVIRGTSDRV